MAEYLHLKIDHMLTNTITAGIVTELAQDVRTGLTKIGQKELPSKYLYDTVGSALFEVISALPEYGITRADERLLRKHSREIVSKLSSPVLSPEIASCTAKKTHCILE